MTVEEVRAAGGFGVILADPAWPYKDSGVRGGVDHHYPTMTLEQICALPVGKIAAPDCALFLWATWPNLPMALEVVAAWGFTYKTCAFDWIKLAAGGQPLMGLGRYTRSNSEPCLLATRGKPMRVDAGVRQTIETFEQEVVPGLRRHHSAKPDEVRTRIGRLLGVEIPAIELFAREAVPNWERWGNQVESTVQL